MSKYVLLAIVLVANTTPFSVNATPLDIEATVWQCFNQGYYTHNQSVRALTHPELRSHKLVKGYQLRPTCVLILEDLGIR